MVLLGVIAMISKGCFWQIFHIIIKFVFKAFLDLNISTVHVVLTWYWAHFDRNYNRNQIGAWNISCLWPLVALTNRLLFTKRKCPELSLYTFKAVWRIIFKTPWGKLQNLLGIKLTSDVTANQF